jgi:hypothetical protein
MKRKLDLTKVEAALKRAARTATKGTRDARSGRFVVNAGRDGISGPTKRFASRRGSAR